MRPSSLRALLRDGALSFVLALATACAGTPEDAAGTGDALRELIAGVDVDEEIVARVPAGANAPDAFADVRSWSLRYVELRDPARPDAPDPVEPFIGYFLIAQDASGAPLFFETMAVTDEGLAHYYFSVGTTGGSYREIPLVTPGDDAAAERRVADTTAWLSAEKARVAGAVEKAFRVKPSSLGTLSGYSVWRDRLKCAADLAVFALTLTNPLAFFAAQAVVDGAAALVDGTAGDGEKAHAYASGAAINGGIYGVSKGVGKVVARYVAKEKTAMLKRAGSPVLLVGMVGLIGYQAFMAGDAKGALVATAKLLIPASCQAAYGELVSGGR